MLTVKTLSMFRGVYSKVARQLKVDPSYVSRVARGERASKRISTALEKELSKIQTKITKQNFNNLPPDSSARGGSGIGG